MRNIRYFLLVVAALCALVIGACLPTLAVKMYDSADLESVSYLEKEPVQLTLRQDTREPLSDAQKLMLLCSGSSLFIPEQQAQMTLEEVQAAAEKALQPYLEQGLLRPADCEDFYSIAPQLRYFSSDPKLYNIVWHVGYGSHIGMILDDETGKLLDMNYVAENAYEAAELPLPQTLSDVFLGGLDLLTNAGWSCGQTEGCKVILFDRSVQEVLNLEFNVSQDGFVIRVSLAEK